MQILGVPQLHVATSLWLLILDDAWWGCRDGFGGRENLKAKRGINKRRIRNIKQGRKKKLYNQKNRTRGVVEPVAPLAMARPPIYTHEDFHRYKPFFTSSSLHVFGFLKCYKFLLIPPHFRVLISACLFPSHQSDWSIKQWWRGLPFGLTSVCWKSVN